MADIKISQLPDGIALTGVEELPVVQGGETVKVNIQDVADYISGGTITLDNVLTNGNISGKNIKLITGAFADVDGYVKSKIIRVTDGTNYGDLVSPTGNFTANRTIKLPNASGNLVLSINSVTADANGNIVLAVAPHTHPISDIIGLQTALDLRITTSDADARYYPLTANPAGYITIADVPVSTLQAVTDAGYITTNPVISTNTMGVAGDTTINSTLALGVSDSATSQNITLGITDTISPSINFTVAGLAGSSTLKADHADGVTIQLPNANATLAVSVNGTFADVNGDIALAINTQDLQSVTDIGFTTTNPITAGGFSTTGSSYANDLAVYPSGHLRFVDITSTHSYQFEVGALTDDYIIALPSSTNTTPYLPLSVNGNFADSTGDIALTIGTDLQGVTDAGNTTTNGIIASSFETSTGGSMYTTDLLVKSGGHFRMLDVAGNYFFTFVAPTLANAKTITLPTMSGTSAYLPISVNGNVANASGDITISTGTSLSGTGFVKVSGTTVSYDNSVYITASSTETLTNKSGNISMWTNDSAYITASSSNTLTNKAGNISMWTNNSGYLTANQTITFTGDVTGSGTTSVALTIGSSKVTNTMLAGSIAYSKLTLTNSIVNADINSSAAISLSKMAAMTALRVPVSDASGFLVPSTVTAGELFYLSGATSNIQTQLTNIGSTKQDLSHAAYSFKANGTSSTANATDQVYRNSGGALTYTGTITWTGTTAPSGTTNHSYSWQQIGKEVSLHVVLQYGTAGAANTSCVIDLPSDCPIPLVKPGLNTAGYINYFGTGMILTGPTSIQSASGRVYMKYMSSTSFQMSTTVASSTATMLFVDINYTAA